LADYSATKARKVTYTTLEREKTAHSMSYLGMRIGKKVKRINPTFDYIRKFLKVVLTL
jgi:hypothetical protein